MRQIRYFKENPPRTLSYLNTPFASRALVSMVPTTHSTSYLYFKFSRTSSLFHLCYSITDMCFFLSWKAIEKVCNRFVSRVDLLVDGRTPLGGGGVPEGGTQHRASAKSQEKSRNSLSCTKSYPGLRSLSSIALNSHVVPLQQTKLIFQIVFRTKYALATRLTSSKRSNNMDHVNKEMGFLCPAT